MVSPGRVLAQLEGTEGRYHLDLEVSTGPMLGAQEVCAQIVPQDPDGVSECSGQGGREGRWGGLNRPH